MSSSSFKLEIGRRTFAQEEPASMTKGAKSPATALDVIASKEGKEIFQLLIEAAQKTINKA